MRGPHAAVLLLYSATIFLGAGLLFVVQPMVGKMVLPLLGGTPAVWSTCMVFFQAALLLGYPFVIEPRLVLRAAEWSSQTRLWSAATSPWRS